MNRNIIIIGSIIIFLLIILGISNIFYKSSISTTNNDSTKGFVLKTSDKNYDLSIEIADTEAERMRGLMFRRELGDREGMLFIFEQENERGFWMKDTYIPLDMIFFDANRKFVSVQKNAQPCLNSGYSCPSYYSNGAAKYVLEVKAGVFPNEIYNSDLTFEYTESQ